MVTADAVLAAVSLVSAGALGWAFSLAERMSVVETEYIGLKELINARFDSVEQRLTRIETGVAMNGKLKH